jgi:DNA-binding transcriptional regulator YdaS (Cro superfamily)
VVQHRGMDLRDKLKANGYRQRDLAQRLGVSESNVSRWFAWVVDKRQGTPIPSEALAVISEMTGVEPEVLVAAVAREIAA